MSHQFLDTCVIRCNQFDRISLFSMASYSDLSSSSKHLRHHGPSSQVCKHVLHENCPAPTLRSHQRATEFASHNNHLVPINVLCSRVWIDGVLFAPPPRSAASVAAQQCCLSALKVAHLGLTSNQAEPARSINGTTDCRSHRIGPLQVGGAIYTQLH